MRHVPTVLAAIVVLAGCAREEATRKSGPAPAAAAPARAPSPTSAKVEIPELVIGADVETKVRIAWSVPSGTDINDAAPLRVRWTRSDGLASAPEDLRATGAQAKDGLAVDLRPTPGTPNAVLGGQIELVVCDSQTHSVCVPVKRSVELGFIVVARARAGDVRVEIPLPHATIPAGG